MDFATFTMIFLIASSGAQTCLTSSEEFSAEVVISTYDFQRAQILGEKTGSLYAFPSQHNQESLLVLVGETTFPDGLSVRVQRPTETRDIERPHLKFVSYSLPGTVKTSLKTPLYYGWTITCTETECTFEKDLNTITASRTHPERGVTFEIEQELPSCTETCNGLCVALATESRCFSTSLRNDITSILRYANITTTGFQDAFNSYRLVGTDGITVRDITPKNLPAIDWQEAMREELVHLDTLEIITLERKDIELISSLAREGQAGHNYRIIYNEQTGTWMYYDRADDAILSSERDCRAYDLPKKSLVIEPGATISTFYVIPLVLGILGLILLIVLIAVARFLTRIPRAKATHHVPHVAHAAHNRKPKQTVRKSRHNI